MSYDTSLCLNPAENRALYRRKNGTFKTSKFNRARAKFDRCIAGKLSSAAEVVDEIGTAATDIADSITGGGGERAAYVPDYSQGGGASGGEEFFDQNVGGIPIFVILGSVVALMLWSK